MSSVLVQSADSIAKLRGFIEALPAGPQPALTMIRSELAGLAKSLSDEGFSFCAKINLDFVKTVDEILAAYEPNAGAFEAEEVLILQFFANDAVQCLEAYFAALQVDPVDSEKQYLMRMPTIEVLGSWRPTPVTRKEEPKVETQAVVVRPQTEPEAEPEAEAETKLQAEPEVIIAAAVEVVAQAAPKVAPPPPPAKYQFLICRSAGDKSSENVSDLGGQTFAIPIGQILEVIDSQDISPLPFPREGLAGILNFRGDPLPILVCQDRTNGYQSGKDYIVIARVNEKTFGFEMEQVLAVTEMDPTHFQVPATMLTASSRSWVTHLAKQGEEIVMIMDLTRAIAA